MSTLIPNTFQCFNLYIDRALEHLTDSEVRVLWYATRHILGWQDTIKERHKHISLTMFEDGYTTKNGSHYGGCGLGRGAIITACNNLVEFKFLARIGKPDEYGQEWELTTDDIQWAALEARTTDKTVAHKAKTQKATTAMINKRAGTSNEPPLGGTSDVTMLGTSDVTPPHNVVRTESKPCSKPESKPSIPSIAPNVATKKKDTIPAALMNPMKDAIVAAFGWDWKRMTKQECGIVQGTAKDLCTAGFEPERVGSFYVWCKAKFSNFSPKAMATHLSEYRLTRLDRPAVDPNKPMTETEYDMANVLEQQKREAELYGWS